MQKQNWAGVFPAATTAFTRARAVDRGATAAHGDALVRAGVHGLVVLGTVGENHSLDAAEKRGCRDSDSQVTICGTRFYLV